MPQKESPYILDEALVANRQTQASLEPNSDTADIASDLLAQSSTYALQAWDSKEDEIRKEIEFIIDPSAEQPPFFSRPSLTKAYTPHLYVCSSVEELESYLPFTTATTQWNENFDLDIAFLPHPEEKGYIFSLTLHPNFDISQYSLKHDILFIIDCSTRKHRFESYKRAVIKALTSLQQGDSFNIYIVDKKQTQLHTTSLPVNAKTIREAEQFLEQQSKSFSSRADIFTTLNNVLLDTNQNNSVHTAILVTDGLWRSCAHKQQNELKKWVETNAGRLSVYTAAVGQGNDLVMLDLLSSISGGKLLWSDTHAAFPRKLAKLILDLKDPIATDLSFDAIAMHSNTHIKLSEKSFTPPALFSHQPYVICGQIDRPGPFELLIQGRHGDQWIAIRKNVSFMEGKKADRTLIDKWSSSHAQHTYAKFLQDGKNVHLKEARDILKRSRTQVAFE